MPDLCPRCDAVLPTLEGNEAKFCAACGLRQLRVPLEALQAEGSGTPAADRQVTGGVEWSLAFRILAVATVLAVLPCAVRPDAVATGGVGALTLLLLPLLTLGSGAAYLRRKPFPAFTAAIGARLGTALAILVAVTLMMLSGGWGFVLRYGMHSHAVAASLDAAVQQMTAQMHAGGTTLPPEWDTVTRWPEVRAGAFLLMEGVTSALMVVVGAVSGAVAGVLLGARQRRSRG